MMYEERMPCVATNSEPTETLKSMLENMNAILSEIDNQVDMLSEAFYGRNERTSVKPVSQENMENVLYTVKVQRDSAERILKKIVKIREGLW